MQIHFDVAADVAKIDVELKDQQTDAETGEELFVAANDNGLRWPLIPFPEGWYASFESADQSSRTGAAQSPIEVPDV